MLFSVLEQFDITKIPLCLGTTLLGLPLFNKIYTFIDLLCYKNYLRLKGIFYLFLNNFKSVPFFLIRKTLKIFYSFFLPTSYTTKNYMYGKIVYLAIKVYLNLFYRHKILMFWRFNSAVIKVKVQLIFQQAIKTNFGLHYPYYNRLLNYYPYIATVFFLIVFHNFNGLLFYGLLIQLFYYKIL